MHVADSLVLLKPSLSGFDSLTSTGPPARHTAVNRSPDLVGAIKGVPGDRLGSQLKAWRRVHAVSIREMAGLVGCAPSTIVSWENGRVPSPRWIVPLSEVMATSPDAIRRLAGRDRVRRPERSGGPCTSRLAAARLSLGLSQREVAAAVHVSTATVSRWESGLRRPPEMLLASYAEALSTSVEVVRDWLRTYPESSRDTLGRLRGLRHAMADRGYAAEDLARASGVSTALAEEWLRGRRSLPGSVVPVVSDLLGTDVIKARTALLRSVRPASGLASLRAARGLTQAELGQAIGVSKSTVGMWEIGRARPNDLRLRLLSASLRLEVADVAAALDITPPAALEKDELMGLPLGARLKALRRQAGFDCEQVARIVGVRGATIRSWESGATQPRERFRQRLALALSCHESTLMSDVSRDSGVTTTSLRGTG